MRRLLLLFLLGAMTCRADAHAWSAPYYLPLPLWLYSYASVSALLLTYAVVALGRKGTLRVRQARLLCDVPNGLIVGTSLVLLLLLVASAVLGVIGPQNAFQNIGMNVFWVWLYIGMLYLTVVFGDFYTYVNPFKLFLAIASTWVPRTEKGLLRYDQRLGYFPALAAYALIVSLELFGKAVPLEVTWIVAALFSYALVGSLLFGRQTWVAYFDPFRVLFWLCSQMSPFEWKLKSDITAAVHFSLDKPLERLTKPQHWTVVLFLTFMLASTAYDGLHETAPWSSLFWHYVYAGAAFIYPSLRSNYLLATDFFWVYQTVMLYGASFVYLLAYLGTMASCKVAMRWVVRARTTPNSRTTLHSNNALRGSPANAYPRDPEDSERSLDNQSSESLPGLAGRFCMLLLPIAVFYHVAHYFTFFIAQISSAPSLLSDPLGKGWNLLGLASALDSPVQQLLGMNWVWHAQVLLILVGHLIGVIVAHAVSTIVGRTRKGALLIHAPALVLTLLLTVGGLYILSLPFG
ncbi:hypothetical protein VK92_15320 [Burkholderia sp. LK4]|nr:hypothetical protein VL00_05690 [Burkholderia cepacia]KMN59550.1 hypothetical protein VK92_15320 [Burkholderia sp. LK4]